MTRPKDENDLQKREATGVIRASRFVRKYAHSHRAINIQAISLIHREIFREAWPEIAGKYRTENVEITGSKHLPPHFSKVSEMMLLFDNELKNSVKECELVEGYILDFNGDTKEKFDAIEKILNLAARIHHIITFIHPYVEGNGRTARLAGNLILERFGLVGLSVKIV
ncbi:MAG: Fic family protein [Patescibacteria group bacterium]